jgi:hypothetical protein
MSRITVLRACQYIDSWSGVMGMSGSRRTISADEATRFPRLSGRRVTSDANPDLLMNLGRHVGDQTVSYYIRTPGGFFIEYGWGGLPIDDLERRSPRFINFREGKRGEMWGHKFRMQPNEAVHPYAR